MFNLTATEVIDGVMLHAPTIMKHFPYVLGTGLFFIMMAFGLLGYAWRQKRILKEEATFDHDLWTQVTNHLRQRRFSDAEALAHIEQGIFPALYRTGLGAVTARESAAEAMAFLREETRDRFCKELGAFTLVTFVCPFIGLLVSTASLWRVYEDATLIGLMGPLRLAPPAFCAAAGVLVTMLAGMIYTYFTIRLRRINSRLNECSLTLLELLEKNPPAAAKKPETLAARLPSADELLKAVSQTMAAASANREPAPKPAARAVTARELVGAGAGKVSPDATWPPTSLPSKEELSSAQIPLKRETEGSPAPAAAKPETPAPADKPKPAAEAPKPQESVWDNLPHHF